MQLVAMLADTCQKRLRICNYKLFCSPFIQVAAGKMVLDSLIYLMRNYANAWYCLQENNWTNIDFLCAIIVTFSINRSLCTLIWQHSSLHKADWFLLKTHMSMSHTRTHMDTWKNTHKSTLHTNVAQILVLPAAKRGKGLWNAVLDFMAIFEQNYPQKGTGLAQNPATIRAANQSSPGERIEDCKKLISFRMTMKRKNLRLFQFHWNVWKSNNNVHCLRG